MLRLVDGLGFFVAASAFVAWRISARGAGAMTTSQFLGRLYLPSALFLAGMVAEAAYLTAR